jgi:L-malate glycosyltransferase
MKIGIISTVSGYEWAGSEELWYHTALEALKAGHDVATVVSADMSKGKQMTELSQRGATIHFGKSYHPRIAKIKERLYSPIRTVISKSDILLVSAGSLLDLIYLPGLLDNLRAAKIPFVILCQFNSDLLRFGANERTRVRELMQSSAGQVFVSIQNQEIAKRQLAASFTNAKVIYNPIRTHFPTPLPLTNGDVLQFASVARMDVLWKGQDLLLEVLVDRTWKDRNWHLNLYGTGPDFNYVKDLIKYYELLPRVTCHGYVREVEQIWTQNSLHVLPSRGEGTPLAVLEAMMCGRATVTTDVGGNSEIIEHGKTGWISEGLSASSFHKTLDIAWSNQNRFEEMGRAAHASVVKKVQPAPLLFDFLLECHSNAHS